MDIILQTHVLAPDECVYCVIVCMNVSVCVCAIVYACVRESMW